MKILTTKLPVTINKDDFKRIVCLLHHIRDSFNEVLNIIDEGYVIQSNDILAFKIIQNNYVYNYIYNHYELYISVDCEEMGHYIDMIQYLIDHHNIVRENILYLDNRPILLEDEDYNDFKDFLFYKITFPVIYIHQYHKYPNVLEKLASQLKGIAYVVSSDDSFYSRMKKDFHLHKHNYIFYLKDDYSLINNYNENEDEYVKRIVSKIKEDCTKQIYQYPFDMKKLYKQVLLDLIRKEKERGNKEAIELENKMSFLDKQKAEYKKRISKLDREIEMLKEKNVYSQLLIKDKDYYPILLKGDIKEFYQDEQKDIILYLLKEQLKFVKNGEDRKIILDLIDQNKSNGVRDDYLRDIKQILYGGRQLNSQSLEKLKKCGIRISKDGKHMTGNFFNDPKYTITIASSPSDSNYGRQVYRQIKKFFF
jgi:hypothetical protein